ncbi:phenylalanine--tRNA ligase subunit alpha [endosymbiont of Pachyrhynchus infernalis]|uniref:phenylalanine--tRNA ligase subunit alpha n=1 Tax=endosymbiont of Pachyrhynchus infernalis TaxID=1971488 RepID=UPI000DC72239|nr:phenylalanine--tRNA ligase subunit alpha [endosymbiont of Pachyrhynchus infernalis]BBA84864.1 phenylalanine--tRNA ligase alpha subunit [endosymbiont of Pachyrhynchus infernalis]
MKYYIENKELLFLKLNNIIIRFKEDIKTINNLNDLNILKSKLIGKYSFINKLFKYIYKLDINFKKDIGKKLNLIKYEINNIYIEYKNKLSYNDINYNIKKFDINLPGKKIQIGSFHPISIVILKIENYFNNLGFKTFNCLEIENSYYNFDALNISKNHPSRSNKDTFWIDNTNLLRTQTSCCQIRFLEKNKHPIKIISYGKVYRNDKDKTHTPMFHQFDGFIIDKFVNLKILKNILENFISYFFDYDKKIKIKFRHSYFPFTEPSLELDIKNKYGKWIEVLGCGLIHPNVLNNLKINKKYVGLAFGIGIERLTMLKYDIDDIKILFENNIRFLNQFSYE